MGYIDRTPPKRELLLEEGMVFVVLPWGVPLADFFETLTLPFIYGSCECDCKDASSCSPGGWRTGWKPQDGLMIKHYAQLDAGSSVSI